jgi:hypothetical protein
MSEVERLMRGLIELLYIDGHITNAQYSEVLSTIRPENYIEQVLQALCYALKRDGDNVI